MNNVSHGVAALRDERGKEGTKEEIRVGYAQDYEGGDIRSREKYGRRRKSPREGADRERTYTTKNGYFTMHRFSQACIKCIKYNWIM